MESVVSDPFLGLREVRLSLFIEGAASYSKLVWKFRSFNNFIGLTFYAKIYILRLVALKIKVILIHVAWVRIDSPTARKFDSSIV